MASNTISHLKKQWNNLGRRERAAVGVLAAVDSIGKSAALASLARTPKERVRGPKLLWGPVIASVNTLGWIAWFVIGTKK